MQYTSYTHFRRRDRLISKILIFIARFIKSLKIFRFISVLLRFIIAKANIDSAICYNLNDGIKETIRLILKILIFIARFIKSFVLRSVIAKVITKSAIYYNFNGEREDTLSHFKNGDIQEAITRCRRFIHNYWNCYFPIDIGDNNSQEVYDVSCHVAAMDDVLSEWLENDRSGFTKKTKFLKQYIRTFGDYRIPYALLALEYLKHNDFKNAIYWGLAAYAFEKRCRISLYILKSAYSSLRESGDLEHSLSIEDIKKQGPFRKAHNILTTDFEICKNLNAERDKTLYYLKLDDFEEAIKRCRRFVHNYGRYYHPIHFGELNLHGVNDVSGYVAAMDDVLSEWLSSEKSGFAEKISFLKKYIDTYSDHRIPHVLLALEYLEHDDYKNAIHWGLAACAIDERCMISWQVLKSAFISLRENGELENYLSFEDIKRLEPLGYDLKGKICTLAFDRVFIQSTGDVMCCCPPLVPVSIGNVFEDNNWRDIINSDSAKEIRSSIVDGSYRYCNRLTCQEIRNVNDKKGDLFDDVFIKSKFFDIASNENRIKSMDRYLNTEISTVEILNLGFDQTCNLHCPQCRKGFIKLTDDTKKKLDHLSEMIIPEMIKSSKEIVIANTGDPLASKYYFKVLTSISESTHRHLKSINIFTNGLLLDSNTWNKLKNLHPFDIAIIVSVDAMTEITYNKVRPPGKWNTLVDNLIFISGLLKTGKIKFFELEYVIQDCNFREIKEFAYWALNVLKANRIVFHRLINVGTYSDEDYNARAVFNENHPHHLEFIDILKDPIFKDECISFTDLGYCLKKALNKESYESHDVLLTRQSNTLKNEMPFIAVKA